MEKRQFYIGNDVVLSEIIQDKLFEEHCTLDTYIKYVTNICYPWLLVNEEGKIIWSTIKNELIPVTNNNEYLGYELITEDIDYTRCDPIIAKHLKKGKAIRCIKPNTDGSFLINGYDAKHKLYFCVNDCLHRNMKPLWIKAK